MSAYDYPSGRGYNLTTKNIRDSFYREALGHAMVAVLAPEKEYHAAGHFRRAVGHYERTIRTLRLKDTVAKKRKNFEHWKECIKKELGG